MAVFAVRPAIVLHPFSSVPFGGRFFFPECSLHFSQFRFRYRLSEKSRQWLDKLMASHVALKAQAKGDICRRAAAFLRKSGV
jgi:hypothetical protein